MSGLTDGLNDTIRILYVNSDPAFAELVQTKLQQTAIDIACTPVNDPDEVSQKLEAADIDCIVTAYSLDGLNGIELAKSLRTRDSDIPILLFTGQGSEEIASRATQAGVSDYIPVRSNRDNFTLLANRIQTLTTAAREREAAERTQQHFRRTLERTTDAVYAVDTDWRIEYMNDKMAARIDREPDTLIGATLWEEFPSIVGTELEDKYRTAMETGESVSFEHHLGDPFNYTVEARAFPDDEGLTVFSRERTTERERERSDRILETIHDVVFVLGEDRNIEFANAAAKRLISGDKSDQLAGTQFEAAIGDRMNEHDMGRLLQAVETTLDGGEGNDNLAELYDTDLQVEFATMGSNRTFDIRVTSFQRAQTTQVLLVARDVTKQSEATRRLERDRDALRQLQNVMAEGDVTTQTRLEGLLEVGCRYLGLEIGIVSQIQDSDYSVEAVHGPDADIAVGDRFDLSATYCAEVVDNDAVCSFIDAVADGKETHPAYRTFELESYIGAPLVVDGTRYGTVNFSSPTTQTEPFGALERTFVELLTELVSAELSRAQDRTELKRQEFLFERVQTIADLGVWEYTPSTGELEWSDGVKQIHGVDETYEPSLEDGLEFYHPDDRETVEAAVNEAIEEGTPYDLDLRIIRADGETRDVRAWGERVGDTPHSETTLRGVFQDITERKAKEREYRELAEEYEALLETSGDAIFLLDVDTTGKDPSFEFARLSPGYEMQTGITTEEVRGKSPQAVFGDERGAELDANYTRCVEQREPISYQEELDIADDARFWETSLAPVIVDGDIVRVMGIARNVTQQVTRERSLETTNQRLESLIEATPLTVMEIDSDGIVTRWNSEAENMFGWSREDVIGEFNPIIPEDNQGEFSTHRQRALSGERIRGKEVRRVTKDGDELDLLLSVAPVTDPDGETTSILAVLEDITDQKRLEAKLRALQETARRLSGAQSSDEIGDIAVEAAVEILGFEFTGLWEYDATSETLVALSASDATMELLDELPDATPDDSLAWDAFEASEVRIYDDLHAESSVSEAALGLKRGLFVPVGEFGVMAVGTPVAQSFSDTDVDLFRILGATVEAAFARASREAELQRQNERLDEFASVVAHDLRNPLSVAIGFREVIESTGELEHLDRIESAHDRMERMIDDLLTLARGETSVSDTEQVDIGAVTTEAWGYVDTADATLTVADQVPTLVGDGSRLIQLFENLFRNAIEHGGDGVTVTVGQLDSADGFYIEDDGPGIPPDQRKDVFEHGVTTNEGGTGFGLSIVADIAAAHGWSVRVTDGDDGGARFEFTTAPDRT
ncbi:PAS domain-containing protein [Halovenus salina]|uniref:PAS domain-containing protein n=1 Tax=Halovenus salina TaxID=1510225 RepID=UPI002260C4A2|nr:PAS domain-containing protein [Halovenus salina]